MCKTRYACCFRFRHLILRVSEISEVHHGSFHLASMRFEDRSKCQAVQFEQTRNVKIELPCTSVRKPTLVGEYRRQKVVAVGGMCFVW